MRNKIQQAAWEARLLTLKEISDLLKDKRDACLDDESDVINRNYFLYNDLVDTIDNLINKS